MRPTYFRGGILAAAFLSAAAVQAQNVGIGTTTPKSKLSVNGSTASGGIAVGDATYTSTTGTVAPLNGAIIQGNVGIGTTSPSQLLHVHDGNFLRNNSDGTAFTIMTTDGSLRTYRDGPSKAVPTVNGYLDVLNDPTAGTPYGRMYYYKGLAGQTAPLNEGEGLAFYAGTSTSPQMLLETSTGSLGIGTVVPQGRLHVNGQAYVAAPDFTGSFWNGTADMNGVQINPDGYIGLQREVGASLYLSKPAGAAVGQAFAVFNVDGTGVGTITRTAGGVSYNTTSDERLKENIRPSAKGLADVMKIRVSDYNYKASPGHDETGFIAQQLEDIVPDAVTPGGADPAKQPWTVDYGRVTPMLTKAIQEQQAEIELMKSKLAAMETENAELKAANAKLSTVSSDLEALKKAVATMQAKDSSGAVRTVSLAK